jgi:hypothetical protein
MGRVRATKRVIRLVIVGLGATALGILSAANASAQTEVTIEPAHLTVVGMHGTKVETRNVFLRTSKPIKNFQIIALDLNRADGSVVFPAEAIFLEKTLANPIKPNELTALVGFNLQKMSSSGEFSGKLRLSYQDGEQIIPVTVRVKDNWLPPLIMLLIGTALGVGVSIYRNQGRPRDEILVRVSQLSNQIQDDPDLTKAGAFQSHVEAHLVDVKMAIQTESWEEAKNAVKEAEIIWSKWNKGRSDWLKQLAYCDEMRLRLQDLNPTIPFVQAVRRNLEDAVQGVPDLDTPSKLRERLDIIAQQINRYFQLQTKIKQINSLCSVLPDEQAKPWQSRSQDLEQKLNNSQPSELAADTKLQTDVEVALTEITQIVTQQQATGTISKGLPKLGLTPPLIAPAPSTSLLSWEKPTSGANKRLKVFTLVSYGIAIVFLAGAGFSQLYDDKPTFGANPWKDYFALLAWGFGAEATRDAITKVVQGWGLPGLK